MPRQTSGVPTPQAETAHPCPLCGGSAGHVLYGHRGRIVRCSSCGLVRQDPVPSPADLYRVYRSADYFRIGRSGAIGYGDYFADEPMYRRYFRLKIAALAPFAHPPGKLFEIGAAAGYALDEASRAGWSAEGVELSPQAVAYARERFRVKVREGGIDHVPGDGSCDVMAAFQVVEHVADVRRALRAIVGSLRPGGVAIFTTPDHASLVRRVMRQFWLAYRPEHLVYFDRRTIRLMLEACGLEVLRIRGDDPLHASVGRLLERVVHYNLRRSIPVLPGPAVPVWLGDMEVIARRPA